MNLFFLTPQMVRVHALRSTDIISVQKIEIIFKIEETSDEEEYESDIRVMAKVMRWVNRKIKWFEILSIDIVEWSCNEFSKKYMEKVITRKPFMTTIQKKFLSIVS